MSLDLMTKFETDLWSGGCDYIAGIDEVGRGALAGPMVVAAAVINKKHLYEYILSGKLPADNHTFYSQIRDSKKLTPKKRDFLNEYLLKELVSYSIIEVSHLDIDKFGISKCTQIAFFKAVQELSIKPEHVLTDTFEIKSLVKESQTNIVQGDNKSITIAAASIIAKVYRDSLMVRLHNTYNEYQPYGFDVHKGYGTVMHRSVIKQLGLTNIHRKSFKVK